MDISKEDKELELRTAAALGKLRGLDLRPSPYMKTRVMALYREKQRKSQQIRFWRVFSALSGSIAAAVIVLALSPLNPFSASNGYYGATVNRQIAIRLDLSAESEQVAYVEVTLPNGVEFYSKRFPELASQRMLTLPKPQGAGESLPIVVLSNQAGIKDVTVKFLGSDKQILAVRKLKIKFTDTRSASADDTQEAA